MALARGFALLNGEIWTLREPGERVSALLVRNGVIESIGADRRIEAAASRNGLKRIDLQGRRVVPGLIDSHAHLVHQGILPKRVDLWETKSLEEALQKVRRHLHVTMPGHLVMAERFDETRWREKRFPRTEELDAISTKYPIIVRRVDGHIAVANRVALEKVAKKLKGVDWDKGLLVEEASLQLYRVFPTPPKVASKAAARAQGIALKKGVVAVHDFVHPSYWEGWFKIAERGLLDLRVTATPYLEVEREFTARRRRAIRSARLKWGGVKIFADGAIGAHTAALRTPYKDRPKHRGRKIWTDAQMARHLSRAQKAGRPASVHAIGDAAIEQVLKAIAKLPPKRGIRPPHRIEHFELADRDQWERARELGVVVSMQPNFVGHWSTLKGLYGRRLGSPRHRTNNPFRSLLKDGVRVAFGSDCMPFDPWFGMESAVRAPHPAQRLTMDQALACYTRGSADGLGNPAGGVLEVGAPADLIVVTGDWGKKGGIAGTKVRATYIGGERVYSRG